jgi:zinc transporter
MMRAFLYNDDKATELPFADGAAHFGQEELVWLHLDGRLPEARSWIDAQEDIPELAREALRASETRPRSDVFGSGVIINMRGQSAAPEHDPDPLVSIRFWAERGRVISLCYRQPKVLDAVIDDFLSGDVRDPGDLITDFARAITDGLDPEVAALGDALDDIEPKIDSDHARSTRRKVSHIRAEAIGFRRFVAPQREALSRLATVSSHCLDDEDRLHLRESADRYARMAEELEAVRERAAVIHDELTDLRSEQMDARGLLISIVALIFLPLTFLTGLLGMNVEGIPYKDEPWAFWGVVAACVVTGLAVLAYFISARWIRGR